MSLTHAVTISCNHPAKCATTFGPVSNVPGGAKAKARAAGWYIGANDKAYCPPHVEALGLRTRAPS